MYILLCYSSFASISSLSDPVNHFLHLHAIKIWEWIWLICDFSNVLSPVRDTKNCVGRTATVVLIHAAKSVSGREEREGTHGPIVIRLEDDGFPEVIIETSTNKVDINYRTGDAELMTVSIKRLEFETSLV